MIFIKVIITFIAVYKPPTEMMVWGVARVRLQRSLTGNLHMSYSCPTVELSCSQCIKVNLGEKRGFWFWFGKCHWEDIAAKIESVMTSAARFWFCKWYWDSLSKGIECL